MRIFLQSIFAAACVALLALGFQRGWWQALAEMPPADRQVWLQGIWPVQDQLASEIGAHAQTAGADADHPLRVALRMDTSAIAAWQYAPLRQIDWEHMLEHADSVGGAVVMVAPDATPPPDLIVDLIWQSYARGEESDELTGVIRYTDAAFDGAPSAKDSSTFRAVCPVHARDLFVRPARRTPGWLIIAAVIVITIVSGLGCWAAWQTFTGRFDRSFYMNICAGLSLAIFLVLMSVEIAPAGYGRFGIPRWSVRVVVDTSDAVRFLPPDRALRPDTPAPDAAPMNDVCRFVEHSIRSIAQAVQSDSAPTGAGFKAWLRYLWRNLGREHMRSGLLRSSETVRVFHGLPLAGPAQDTAGSSCRVADLSNLSDLLRAGQRGHAPGFFLPWSAASPGADKELIVAFCTGEPVSMRQAEWLASERARLRAEKPEGLRVLTVLLPSLPRSEHPGWSLEDRLRNAAAVSDVVLAACSSDGQEDKTPAGLPAPVEWLRVFTAAETNSLAQAADLDALRSDKFRADSTLARVAAERIAERAQGLSDVRSSATFQTSPTVIFLAVCIVAGILLFLRLQREIRLLDRRRPTGNLEWLGALLGGGIGLCVALLIAYMVSEPLRWRTLARPGSALWAVVCIWYAAVWLPMLLGRGLGFLPPPEEMLRVRRLAWWFAALMVAMLITAGIGCCWALLPGGDPPMWVVSLGMGVVSAAALALALRYQWVSFWRRSRRRTWCLGTFGLALLLGLPILSVADGETGILTPWWWAAVTIAACLLPAVGALSVRRQYDDGEFYRKLGLGWSGLVYGLLIGVLAPLALLCPWPN
ncbi:MAG: hypothetical protein ACOYCD_08220 [Kiritimatiellia bacterium]|jgi:hypothetical protein